MTEKDTLEIGAAYVRVSTDDQTELSPDAQVRLILEAAKTDGYVIPKDFIFIESRGISGRKADNRPEFQRMIATAKSQSPAPFKRLYLWKFSRFARNQDESTFYKSILRKKCGIEIKSISEPIADGMFGRLIETIIEWFDEYYSFNLSGEVKRGMQEKALRQGYQMVPSLGYTAVGEGKPFVIDEEKYKIVEYIFQAYHDGLDMTGISRECNRRGWLTRRGHPFERRTIFRILSNKFYTGLVVWNGYEFQGTHETRPSVTAVWDECQERISREYRPLQRREVSSCKHWLSGLLRCSICGASLSYHKNNSGDGRSSVFQCWKYMKGYHKGSSSMTEQYAVSAVMESLQAVIAAGVVEFEHVEKPDNQKQAEEQILSEALSRLEIKEKRIREAYENEIDTLEEYKENKLRLAKEREDLIREYQELQERYQDKDTAPSEKDVLNRIRTVYDLISDPNVGHEVKGVAIRSVLKEIVWDRQNKKMTFCYYA